MPQVSPALGSLQYIARDRKLRYHNDGHRVKSRLKQYRYKSEMQLRKHYRWKGTVKFVYFSVKIERKQYGLVHMVSN